MEVESGWWSISRFWVSGSVVFSVSFWGEGLVGLRLVVGFFYRVFSSGELMGV